MFSNFFPCGHVHPRPQGIFPLLARVLPQIINTCPHVQYPCHKLVKKMVGQILYKYSFQVTKGNNATNFTLWPPKKKENNGNICQYKIEKKNPNMGKIYQSFKTTKFENKALIIFVFLKRTFKKFWNISTWQLWREKKQRSIQSSF